MSNLFLTTNAKFQPFTLDRYLQPIQAYDTAYKDVETKLGELAEKADVWDNMIDPNKEGDEAVYQQYKQYSDDVNAAADALASEGLRAMSRAKLLDLKRRYSKEIIPIEQAYAARAAEAKEQQAGRAQGMIYEGDAATSGLSRYMGNTQLRYKGADAKAGLTKVGAAAQALAKQLREYKITGHIDKYNKQLLQSYGISPENVSNVISNLEGYLKGTIDISQMDSASKNAIGALTTIVQNELGASGVDQWSNQDAIKQYRDYIATGLYGAIGGEQSQVIQDVEAHAALNDYYNEKASQRALNNQLELLKKQNETENKNPTDDSPTILLNSTVEGKDSSPSNSESNIRYAEDVKGWVSDKTKETGKKLHDAKIELLKNLKLFNDRDANTLKGLIMKNSSPELKTKVDSLIRQTNVRSGNQKGRLLRNVSKEFETWEQAGKDLMDLIHKNQAILKNHSKEDQAKILNKLDHLRKQQEVRQDIKVNLTPNKKKTTTPLSDIINSAILNQAGVVLTDRNGNRVTKSDILDSKSGSKNLALYTRKGKLYIEDYEGNEYNVSGVKTIEDAEKKSTQLNTILGNFDALPKASLMKQEEINKIMNDVAQGKKHRVDKTSLSGVKDVTDYKQAIIGSSDNTNVYKIITDKEDNVVLVHDLQKEIDSRGATRVEAAALPFADLMAGNTK